MALVLARVDNRLIHGQVLEAWVPFVRADYLVVVDDTVAADPFRSQLMLAVVPQHLRVEICSQSQVAVLVQRHLEHHHNLLILFATPQDALRAYEQGLHFSELNLGNMHLMTGKQCLSCTLAVDEADMAVFDRLSQLGVTVQAQCIPTDRVRRWNRQCHCLGD